MINRRRFIGSSLAAIGASGVGLSAARRASAAVRPMTDPTTQFALANATNGQTVYAYVHGYALDNGNALFLLQSDGQTPYYPSSPSSTLSPLAVDCAIPLNSAGASPVTITVPHLAGARVWFSFGTPLTFYLNPGPALVEPSTTNTSDPNIDLYWDFCEFTYNDTQLFANISCVDFVSIPIGLQLTDTANNSYQAPGLPNGGLDTVCSGLTAQAQSDGWGWDQLIVTNNGANLRALSPYGGSVMNPSLFANYFEPYVSQVWQQYSSSTLTIDTQSAAGIVTGQVSNGQLVFPGIGAYNAPSTADILSCATGPFDTGGQSQAGLAIIPRLAAPFNRTTLLIDANQPDGEDPSTYYTNSPTNHYARIVHATEIDGRGYAFPYDDVAPTGGADQSGAVASSSPQLLTITVGTPTNS